MIFRPATVKELTSRLADAHRRGEKLGPIDLTALDRLLEHTPEDMTAAVEAGITLASLQSTLGQRRQWLPIDPPRPESTTIADILNTNASGPRRFGYGTIREHLIGLKVALSDGRIIKAGGKVVKNVAGYDLCKLFVGSRGTLGVIVEAVFKLRPLPEAEQFVQAKCDSLEQAGQLLDAVLESDLTPVALDLHNLSTLNPQPSTSFCLVAGFAGTREEVEWQLQRAKQLGLGETSTLDYAAHFWAARDEVPVHVNSVLPSRLIEALRQLGPLPFLARAGNGVIFHRGGTPPSRSDLPLHLMRRMKETYDPKNILPDWSW